MSKWAMSEWVNERIPSPAWRQLLLIFFLTHLGQTAEHKVFEATFKKWMLWMLLFTNYLFIFCLPCLQTFDGPWAPWGWSAGAGGPTCEARAWPLGPSLNPICTVHSQQLTIMYSLPSCSGATSRRSAHKQQQPQQLHSRHNNTHGATSSLPHFSVQTEPISL